MSAPALRRSPGQRFRRAQQAAELVNEMPGYRGTPWTPKRTVTADADPPVRVYVRYEGDDIGHLVVSLTGELYFSEIDSDHRDDLRREVG